MDILTQRSRATKMLGALLVCCLFSWAMMPPFVSNLRAQSASEYELKAVFLYNFAQFVEWPAEAFSTPESPLVIGVLGRDPFGRSLTDVVQNESAHGRKIEVRHFQRVDEIGLCHILFISTSEESRLERILPRLGHRPILTVGDCQDFALRGGMIRFMMEGKNIRLRINRSSVKSANLTISSKLLRAAEIVGSDPKEQ